MTTSPEPSDSTTELPNLSDGEVVERIDRANMVPINDTNHDHQFKPDYEDETDEYIAMMCQVRECGLGYLQAK